MIFVLTALALIFVIVVLVSELMHALKNKKQRPEKEKRLYELKAEQEAVHNEIRIHTQIIRDSNDRLSKLPRYDTEYRLVTLRMIHAAVALHSAEDRLDQIQTKYRELIDPY